VQHGPKNNACEVVAEGDAVLEAAARAVVGDEGDAVGADIGEAVMKKASGMGSAAESAPTAASAGSPRMQGASPVSSQ